MIQFQIASNRKRRIVEDGVDKKTDYVWIKAYGLKAAEYAAALHIHSNVSINGAIQTRSYVKEYECPYCGQISKIAYLAVEVIPYSIEYGANCTLPDPQEREKSLMKQTRLADRLTANQIEAKNVEERNLSEMKRDMGDSHISFQRSRRIKNKTSVKLKRSKEKRLASIRRSLQSRKNYIQRIRWR